MYEYIREQIKIWKEGKQKIPVLGYFNAKIAEVMEG